MDEADTQELTQRLHADHENDQIGYLLVEGFMEHPIRKGVTLIGRDPQKCDIVLEDESVSKMHAVIRIKTATEFFLIDMMSKNGTKCKGIPLKPKCPTQFHYDDKIEFGSVFVLLRRSEGVPLDHESSLPMTQAMETPVRGRSTGSLLKQVTIPESPEGSDKEDSFLAPSRPQPRQKSKDKNHSNSKTINKDSSNESLFWKASSRSPSLKFDLDDSTSTINDSLDPDVSKGKKSDIPKMSINEMDTQIPDIEAGTQQVTGNHMLETQLPYTSPVVDKIHNMNTQLPEEYNQPPSLSKVIQKVEETKEMQINLYSTGKDEESNNNKDQSIYEAATQILPNPEEPNKSMNELCKDIRPEKHVEVHVSESDEEIMCEEFESDDFEVPNSQSLNDVIVVPSTVSSAAQTTIKESAATNVKNKADAKTETVSLADPKSSKNPRNNIVNDDDSTDCEEEDIKTPNDKENVTNLMVSSMNITETCSNYNVMGALQNVENEEDISDLPTQVLPSIAEDICDAATQVINLPIEELNKAPIQKLSNNEEPDVSDLPTQIICEPREDILCKAPTQVVVLPIEDINNAATQKVSNTNEEANVSDLATQIICEDLCEAPTQVIGPPIKVINNTVTQKLSNTKSEADVKDLPTQVIVSEIINDAPEKFSPEKPQEVKSPFKIPTNAALKGKASRLSRNTKSPTVRTLMKSPARVAEEKNYYAATQDIVEDLMSQKDPASVNHYDCTQDVYNDLLSQNDEIVPSSQEDDTVGERFKGFRESLSPLALTRSSSASSGTDESEVTKRSLSGLSTQQMRDLVGVVHQVDMSDMEDTPRKEFDFDELPLSEDISERKTTTRIGRTEAHTTSDEKEGNSSAENSESDSPVVFRKKKRANKVKVNLASRLDPHNLPTRISKRTRKPTEKVKDMVARKESEENIEAEIIQENIAKLKGDKNTQNVAKQTVGSDSLKSEPIKTRKTCAIHENKSDNPKNFENAKDCEKSNENADKQIKPITSAFSKGNVVVTNCKNKNQLNKNMVISDRNVDRAKNKGDLLKEDSASTDSDHEKQPQVKISRLRAKPNVPKSETQNGKNKPADGKKKSVRKLDSSSDSDENSKALPVKRNRINRKNYKGSENYSQNEKNSSRNKKDVAINPIKHAVVKIKHISISSGSDENDKILPVKRSTRGKAITDLKNEPKVKTESLGETNPSIQAVRRSNRQRNSDGVDSATNTPKEKHERTQRGSDSKDSITPKYDQSRVYSMSEKSDVSLLETRVSSPQPTRASRRKMADTEELVAHTPPKRPRTVPNSTPTQRVLFTAYDDLEKRNVLKKLGAEIVEDPNDCTVVVTKQVKRTIKFLCAVSLGRPIVGDQWIQACNKAKKFVDPWSHLLEDVASEKKFKFSLRESLQGPRFFLAGYNITSTPKALPPPHELKVLVECSGGKWKEGGQKWAVVSTKEDRALWPALRKRGATVVSNEFVLSGVLQQTVDLKSFQIPF